MNVATILGFLSGLAVLCWAVWLSTGNVLVYLNLPGVAIVVGGVIASTLICYPMREVARILGVFLTALGAEEVPTHDYIAECVHLADVASRGGHQALEGEMRRIDNEFLKNGLQMVLDGYSTTEIREILDNRIQQYFDQEMNAAGIYRTMARLAPAFGIIGTLIGLIAMMQAMSTDLSRLGPGMAVALTTTLYGALFANMLFLPIAIKVEGRIGQIAILMQVMRDGILFIKDKTPSASIHKR